MSEDFVIRRGYELGEPLGKGGFGAVYRAYQPAVAREVAIKVILPEYASEEEFIRNFEVEAQMIAHLEHPYIVPLYDFWRDETGAYLVMRLLKGGSLRDRLRKGAIELKLAIHYFDQIALALSAAHKNGIVHRDLKPDNILLDTSNNAYLTDFGIARPVGTRPADDVVSGTLAYLSPEQLRGYPPMPQADIYSLGFMLYEMVMGEHPFPKGSVTEILMMHMQDPIRPFVVPDVSITVTHTINEIIQKMTAKDPDLRYADTLEVAEALRKAVASHQPTPPRDPQLVTTQVNDKQRALLQQHIDGLYDHLNDLYKTLAAHASDTGVTVREQIQQVEMELRYRTAGLRRVEQHAAFGLPASLYPPEPAEHTLIGVSEKVASYKPHLLAGKSLVLLGASGAGKTELATALARDPDVASHFGGRVVWIPVGKEGDIYNQLGEWLRGLGASADELSLLRSTTERIKRLQEWIGQRQTLVVIDDLWRIDDVHELIRDRRNPFTYIVTTRQGLVAADLLWETVQVGALDMPARLTLLGQLCPEFRSDDEDAQRLVERVGGLPRDLVLTGTRLRRARHSGGTRMRREVERLMQSTGEIYEQGYAALSLSVEELSDEGRRAFWALSLFPPEPSSFSEDAGEAVSGTLDVLDELVDYSLLKSEDDGEQVRYSMHPSFAEYALKYLPSDAQASQQYMTFYRNFVSAHHRDYDGMMIEARNVENALALMIEDPQQDSALVRSAYLLAPFWKARGMVDVSAKYLKLGLERAMTLGDRVSQAQIHLFLAEMNHDRGDQEESSVHAEMGLTAIREATGQDAERERLELQLVTHQGVLAYSRGDYATARTVWTTALEKPHSAKYPAEVSRIYNGLATVELFDANDPQKAKELYLKSLEEARRVRSKDHMVTVLSNLGQLEQYYFNNMAQAAVYLNESVKLAREHGDYELTSHALQSLGNLELSMDNLPLAKLHLREALQKARASHSVERIGYALMQLANMLVSLDDFSQAENYLVESLDYARRRNDKSLISWIANVVTKVGDTRIIKDQRAGYKEAFYVQVLDLISQPASSPEDDVFTPEQRDRLRGALGRLRGEVALPEAVFHAHMALGRLESIDFYDTPAGRKHFDAALQAAETLDKPELIALALLELTELCIKTEDSSAAIYLRHAESLIKAESPLFERAAQLRQQLPSLPEGSITETTEAVIPAASELVVEVAAVSQPKTITATEGQSEGRDKANPVGGNNPLPLSSD